MTGTYVASRWRTAAALLPGAVLAVIFAWPTRHGPFVPGDDLNLILYNRLIRQPSLEHAKALLTGVHSDLYQPLPMLSFQLNYFASGASPTSWHIVNLVLHVANTALAGLLAVRLAGCRRVAIAASMLFAAHPMAMDAVGWISGRILLMAAMFTLATLNVFAWRRSDARGMFSAAAILSWVAALLSKVLPTGPIAAMWVDGCAQPPSRTLRGRPRRWWATVVLLLALTAAMTILESRTQRSEAFAEAAEAAGTPALARVLLASRYYFENYIWPMRLTVWAPTPLHVSLTSTPVILGAAEWLALAAIGWIIGRRVRGAGAGIGLFVILIVPFLLATGVRNFLTADRYMYLPMVGLHLAVASTIVHVIDRIRMPALNRIARFASVAAAGFVVAFWISRAWAEADIRKDIFAVGRRAAELYPDDVRVRVKLAKTYVEAGDATGALAVIDMARHRWPDDAGLAGEAGAARRLLREWPAAAAELRRAVAAQPDDLRSKYHLALTLEELSRPDAARQLYREILDARPDYVPAATALARNLRQAGDLRMALGVYDAALMTNPLHRGALLESAAILAELGDAPAAIGRAQLVLEQNPADLDARLIVAGARAASGDMSGAKVEYEAILRIDPDRRAALIGLHRVLQGQGRFHELVAMWSTRVPGGHGVGGNGDWLYWSETLDLIASNSPIPMSHQPPLNRSFLRAFGEIWRKIVAHPGNAEYLAILTRLKPPTTAGDGDEFGVIIDGLTYFGRNSPANQDLLYMTVVALAYSGQHDLAAMMRAKLGSRPDAAWQDAIRALDVLLAKQRAAASRPTVSPRDAAE